MKETRQKNCELFETNWNGFAKNGCRHFRIRTDIFRNDTVHSATTQEWELKLMQLARDECGKVVGRFCMKIEKFIMFTSC